ncbi:nuclear transport factor 2 family protein [Sorangium sp. So ce429]
MTTPDKTTGNPRSAKELLLAYLDNVRQPSVAAALFADDGVLEVPTAHVVAQGPAAVRDLLTNLLGRIPDFRLKDAKIWIETPDRVFAEYSVEAQVPATGKLYKQTYAGLLIALDGKITLLREALDTAAAAAAMTPD